MKMQRISRYFWKDLATDRRGGTLTTVALTIPVLLGLTGLGVEAGLWYSEKRSLQTAADAAATAGGWERARGQDLQDITAAAQREAERNGFSTAGGGTIVVTELTHDAAGNPIQAIEVVLTEKQPPLFTAALVGDNITIRTRAVAKLETTGTACVLATDPTTSEAVKAWGSASVNMKGCVIASNSSSSNAIALGGGANVTAESLWTVGGYTQGGSSALTTARPPSVNVWPLENPYANLAIPPAPTGTCKDPKTSPLQPGRYCGQGPDIDRTVDMLPGLYYLDGVDFKAGNATNLTCNTCTGDKGVTIVLTAADPNKIGDVTVAQAGSRINLRAPVKVTSTDEGIQGMLFFQDSRKPQGYMKLAGAPSNTFTGVLYFSTQEVEFVGSSTLGGCTVLVARKVILSGNSTLDNSGCQAAGVKPVEIKMPRTIE